VKLSDISNELCLLKECLIHYIFLCCWVLSHYFVIHYVIERFTFSIIEKVVFGAFISIFDIYIIIQYTLHLLEKLKRKRASQK